MRTGNDEDPLTATVDHGHAHLIGKAAMDSRRFRWWALGCLVALLGLTAAFPLVLPAFYLLSACAEVDGACDAVAAVVGIRVKPLLLLPAGVGIAWTVWCRLRALGLGQAWVVAVLIWFLGSVSALNAIGNLSAANFAMGQPPALPLPLVFVVIFVLFLALHVDRPAPTADRTMRLVWLAAALTAAHSTLLVSLYVNIFLAMVVPDLVLSAEPVLPHWLTAIRIACLGFGADKVLGVDMLVFMTALIWILLSQRWPGQQVAANAGRPNPV